LKYFKFVILALTLIFILLVTPGCRNVNTSSVNTIKGPRLGTWISYMNLNNANSAISGIVADTHGGVWFSYYNSGLSYFDGNNWETFTTADGLADNSIKDMTIDQSGNIWFAHSDKVSKFDGARWSIYQRGQRFYENGTNVIQTPSIAVDHQGNLWVTADGGVTRYDGHSWTNFTAKDGLADNWVRDITVDATGRVWFATENGLSSFDGNKWASYTIKQGLPHNRVNIVTFHDQALWLGTEYPASGLGITEYEGGGITRFDLATSTFTTYTTDNGLASNYVGTIAFDSTGSVWAASLYSHQGVSRFDGKRWVNYTTSEGLISNTDLPPIVVPDLMLET
jgi:ligand-binding sensor domain-containing protein